MKYDGETGVSHYNQEPRRKAEFIQPPNTLKAKVGSGGLSDEILEKAQALLENNTVDFKPLGEMYLDNLMKGIERARKIDEEGGDYETAIGAMIYPAMQLKANGGMFHYNLVTDAADKLVQFLEVIEYPDIHAIEIVLAFHTTIRAIIAGRITGHGGTHGTELLQALDAACTRYFQKNPSNKMDEPANYEVDF